MRLYRGSSRHIPTSSSPRLARHGMRLLCALILGIAVMAADPLAARAEAGQPALVGSIVDTDTQYGQSRLSEVEGLSVTEKTLSAWKNDRATSEIALAAKGAAYEDVTASASDLTGPAGTISRDNATVRFISSTKAYNGSYLGYGSTTRAVPADNGSNRSESVDIINGGGPTSLEANEVRPIWVSFKIPKDAAAGAYTATITVTASGMEAPLAFTYTINVADATLPDASEFKDTFDIELWQYPYSSAEYYGVTPFSEEHKQILRSGLEIYREMGGHAITATISEDAWDGQTYSANAVHYPSMVKWTKQADGSFSYDFTDFDEWVTLCRSMGLGDKIVLYSIAPWHNSFTYWENGTLKREQFTPGSERYTEVWTDFLNHMIDHLMDKGWFDDSYVGIDERGFSAAAFDLIDSVKNIHGQSLKTAGAMDHFINKHDLAMRVTDLNVGDTAAAASPAAFTKLVQERATKGYRTTLYSCTEHQPGNFSLSAPVESYWSVVNAGKQTSGFLRWAYDAWVADPLRDATHNAFEPGDPFLIYPSERNAAQRVSVPSVRLERMAEGVRDVNKLRKMEADVPALKPEIDALYESIRTKATSSQSYLSAEGVSQLSGEMAAFKAGIDKLTERYINLVNGGSSTIESVAIEGGPREVMVGKTIGLSATVLPSNALDPTLSWASSDDGIASVDASGTVTGNKPGMARITATSNADPAKSVSVTILVTPLSVDDGIAYYSFDQGNAKDSWGNRDGEVPASATFADGKAGKAIRLSAGEAVALPGESGLTGNGPWTIGYWVKSEADLTGRSSVMMDKTRSYSLDLKMASNRMGGFHVGKGGGDVLTFKYPFEADTWYHVTWTQDPAAGLTMYVDGNRVDTNAWTASHNISAPADLIGGDGFTGLVDEVKIYPRVLSDAEVKATMLLPGLNLSEQAFTVYVGDAHAIGVNLVSPHDDKAVAFSSSDASVATVDEKGVVSGVSRGTAVIHVKNEAAGYAEDVNVTVKKRIPISNTLREVSLPPENLTDVHKSEDTSNQYFGQPDMVRTKDGTLITAFPQGHGKGPLIMKVSEDRGETWTEKTDLPQSWAGSQETPTMYTLAREDGSERIMLITACPGWGTDSAGNQYGWNTSYSDDGGKTWSEYRHWHSKRPDGSNNDAIVAMSSLVQLHDESGRPIQKWLGTFHNHDYVNYKTYLTFDENGDERWSDPVPLIPEHRSIEQTYQMCEIGLFRSPDGRRIVGLARSQSHNNPATLIYSDDEGETWSEPMDLPGSLAGERHKAAYDPVSGRLLVTFREICYDQNNNGAFDGANDWLAGDWVAWVGTYDELMNQEDGDYRIRLAEDWANNRYSGDTGYAGVATFDDGTFVMDSYGHWDKEFSQSWTGGVTTDRCYIKQAKFKLGSLDQSMGLVDTKPLSDAIDAVGAEGLDQAKYTPESWKALSDALAAARAGLEDTSLQQVQIDGLKDALVKAQQALAVLPAEPETPGTVPGGSTEDPQQKPEPRPGGEQNPPTGQDQGKDPQQKPEPQSEGEQHSPTGRGQGKRRQTAAPKRVPALPSAGDAGTPTGVALLAGAVLVALAGAALRRHG
ncbi:glycoside hydrolase domain-containing protein [Tractidigestivibacter sp.]|uniref:glycoside hydrolase domain-containing protein n=1 Tax=Tractidigestivibacter sp. TaxID=2847320 RepID=UPI002A91AAD3|nr:glycoside hydrolase domain-containing protein [Tractidigestivibacter sp.]MDY5271576.1 LamG-like jellyroll fold domain-containing protein [Tractidigestivibacter sp.]